MAKGKRITAAGRGKGKRVSTEEPPNYDNSVPIFSLERIQSGNFCFSTLDMEHKARFAEAIYKRHSLTWSEIKKQNKHALGFEKISVSSIKVPKPDCITDDMGSYLAFRFRGKAPMVGYRQKDVFYVLWFDPKFSLYNHG